MSGKRLYKCVDDARLEVLRIKPTGTVPDAVANAVYKASGVGWGLGEEHVLSLASRRQASAG